MTAPAGVREATWSGPLRDLLPHYTRELEQPGAPPAFRVTLPRGATVTITRIPGTTRRLVEIGRPSKPATRAGHGKWELEVVTFKQELGLSKWRRQDVSRDRDGLGVVFMEPERFDA